MEQGESNKDWRAMRDEERARRRETMRGWRAERMNRRGNPVMGGVLMLIAGSVFLLSNLGIVGPFFWRDFWPMLLIVVGAMKIIVHGNVYGRIWGGWMMGMGVLFLAHTMGYIMGDVWALAWPVALILLGVMFLVRGDRWRMGCGGSMGSSGGGSAGVSGGV